MVYLLTRSEMRRALTLHLLISGTGSGTGSLILLLVSQCLTP